MQFRRTEYPVLEAAREHIAAGVPHESALRLLHKDTAREFHRMLGA